jgi:hypothetical protein
MAKEAKPKVIWDNCEFIGEVQKSDRLKLRVELVAKDGVKYINIREWYLKISTDEWKPGFNGVAIPLMIPVDGNITHVFNEILDLATKATVRAVDFPIEDERNKVYAIKKEK